MVTNTLHIITPWSHMNNIYIRHGHKYTTYSYVMATYTENMHTSWLQIHIISYVMATHTEYTCIHTSWLQILNIYIRHGHTYTIYKYVMVKHTQYLHTSWLQVHKILIRHCRKYTSYAYVMVTNTEYNYAYVMVTNTQYIHTSW